jgi:predicted AlkP superfamily pyrophosphatase or phosphodiesterase
MHKTTVIDVVGLTAEMLPSMPRLAAWSNAGTLAAIEPAFPAVTCTAQSDYLTGVRPEVHGIVGNGWYFREECEVHFWRQSNRLVQAPKIWDAARVIDPAFTCANLFWWFNMYSSADYSVTPRPMYPADGRKIPDVYTNPPELRAALQSKLGTFPLFEFWGPRASIRSTEWIAEAAKEVDRRHDATLSLVYLPHLDYPLQKFGTAPGADLRAVDEVCAGLIEYFESCGANVIVLSEYGIRPVDTPVHLNRVLREHGLLTVRQELGLEVLDPGASAAFAVADHQVAHVYVNDRSKLSYVEAILENTAGVERVARIAHPRAGDFVAIAEPRAWFTYYYWLDDRRAPDFARTVDIHRKPGYDPVELFLGAPAVTVAWKLLKRKLGFRGLLDVIPLDASLVKGSHGRPDAGPILLMRGGNLMTSILATDVYTLILRCLQNL